MPKGMRVPIEAGPHGGAVMLEGPAVINQNVILGLIPAGSLHPFEQEITPDEEFIFEIHDMKTAGLYSMHVRKFFSELEILGHARLFPGSKGLAIRPSGPGEEGDFIVTVRFVNLEMNSEEKLEFPVKGAEIR